MSYPNVEPQPSFPRLEREILAFWEADQTFEASIDGTSRTPTSTSSTTARRSPTACRTTATC